MTATYSDIRLVEGILGAMNDCVMTIGPLVDRALREEDDFDGWVWDNLPFSPDTARRCRVMWLLHVERPHQDLPEPFKALCGLD